MDVDECSACGGSWFDRDKLRLAKDQADPDLVWLDFDLWQNLDLFQLADRQLFCPRCEAPLTALEYAQTGVQVDFCSGCQGVWLDQGEFQAIVEALLAEAEGMPVSEYVLASLKEAVELVTAPEGTLSEWRDFTAVVRLLGHRILAEHPRLAEVIAALQSAGPMQ